MQVTWFAAAYRDLEAIYNYIEPHNSEAAKLLIRKIIKMAGYLSEHPLMGRIGRVANTREMIVAGAPYIIAYTITQSHVNILTVLHTSRKWPDVISLNEDS